MKPSAILVVLLIACLLTGPAAACTTETSLTATVTADGAAGGSSWAIQKTATPVSWDIFTGDTATTRYTIMVTKTPDPDGSRKAIEGDICITNTGKYPTEKLDISLDLFGGSPPRDHLFTRAVTTRSHPTLAPGENHCYPYRIELRPRDLASNRMFKVTARVTIANHGGHSDKRFGPSPSATISREAILQATPNLDQVTVTDTFSTETWTFSDSGTATFDVPFSCDSAGTWTSTATIVETGQTASADVTVACSERSVVIDMGDPVITPIPPDWTVGEPFIIRNLIRNPTPLPVLITDIQAAISGGYMGTADCGVALPYWLNPGNYLECNSMTQVFDSAGPHALGVQVTLGTVDYQWDGTATPGTGVPYVGTILISL